MHYPADEQLAIAAAQGDSAALEQLVARHLAAVYRVCYGYLHDRSEAEDAAQETFVKVWRNLDRFDRQRSFKPWLFAVARNTCLDFLKKKRDLAFSDLDAAFGSSLEDSRPAPEAVAENVLLGQRLDKAVESLPAKYSNAIALRHKQDLSFREIAAATRQPLNTVKSHYRRALGKLKARMQKIL